MRRWVWLGPAVLVLAACDDWEIGLSTDNVEAPVQFVAGCEFEIEIEVYQGGQLVWEEDVDFPDPENVGPEDVDPRYPIRVRVEVVDVEGSCPPLREGMVLWFPSETGSQAADPFGSRGGWQVTFDHFRLWLNPPPPS